MRQLEEHQIRRFDLDRGESLSLPGHDRQYRDDLRRRDREYRHRWPVDAPRSAAKNFEFVLPVVDPKDYPRILELLSQGEVDFDTRRDLAAKVFAHTADYDSAIAGYPHAMAGCAARPRDALDGAAPGSSLRRESAAACRSLCQRGTARHRRPVAAPGEGTPPSTTCSISTRQCWRSRRGPTGSPAP